MNISDFDFTLPSSAIAQEPLPERDASRLLVLERGTVRSTHRMFRELPDILEPGDLLVTNRSRVIPARLIGRRASGGAVEILLVRPRGPGQWDALVKPGRRLRAGDRVDLGEGLEATVDEPAREAQDRGLAPLRRVSFQCVGGDLQSVLDRLGRMPLPPYIRRAAAPSDQERYQTIYAREAGSVAAPTAGLHFSERVLAQLAHKGVHRAEILLHVGPGTFQPVKARRVEDHAVEAEPFHLPEAAAAAVDLARQRGGRVIAVGTTVTRVLESCARPDRSVRATSGSTSLAIIPGFSFRVVDGLLTNFHLPRSSLLLLVAAFAGRAEILKAYADALSRGYRFYSYGDAMLVMPAGRCAQEEPSRPQALQVERPIPSR